MKTSFVMDYSGNIFFRADLVDQIFQRNFGKGKRLCVSVLIFGNTTATEFAKPRKKIKLSC